MPILVKRRRDNSMWRWVTMTVSVRGVEGNGGGKVVMVEVV